MSRSLAALLFLTALGCRPDPDADGDGFLPEGGDCNNEDASVNPSAADTVGDGIDNNCDGIDGVDADSDAFASTESGGDDCNDSDETIRPNGWDLPGDGIDQDCDGFDAGEGDTGDTDDTDDTDGPCTAVVVLNTEFPTDGTVNAYYRTAVEVRLSDVDPSASITLEAGGATVPGSSVREDQRVVFTADDPLEPSTDHTATLDYCGGEYDWSFTTSDVGAPTDPAGLVGKSYALDLGSGRFVEPAGVGGLLQSQIATDVLVGVLAQNGTTIDMVGSTSEDGSNPPQQATCQPSFDFPTADFSNNPYFEIGPQQLAFEVQGVTVLIEDTFISGAFAADASHLQGVVLAGSIDTRPLVPLIGVGSGDDAICSLVGTFGVSCQPCPDGGNFCLALYVDNIDADQIPSSLQRQHAADPGAPASSVDVCDNASCSGVGGCP